MQPGTGWSGLAAQTLLTSDPSGSSSSLAERPGPRLGWALLLEEILDFRPVRRGQNNMARPFKTSVGVVRTCLLQDVFFGGIYA